MCLLQSGWTGCTYVSTVEQLGAWTDIKAIHAWGNLFYNSSRKPAYALVRCSSLLAIKELKYDCWLGMLINMNLRPDGFYWLYGHTEPPCLLPLPQGHRAGTWIFWLFFQASFCRKLCLKNLYPFPAVGALGVDLATLLLLECTHASLQVAAAAQLTRWFMLLRAIWSLIISFSDQQRRREERKWEMRKMKDWAWVAFVNKQNLILPS